MSIIERALDRLRDVPREPPAHRSSTGAESVRRPESAEPSVAGARGFEFHPVRRCRIDYDALRSQGVLPEDDADRRLRNEFRRLKWPLLAYAGTAGHESEVVPRGNLIMVASAAAGEGKTFITANLALSIVQEKERRVLVVDADLAKPRFTQVFGLQSEPGLTELLSDPDADLSQAVLGTDIDNLYILPSGRQSETAPELLASKRMQQIAEQLVTASGELIVLFDSSPLLLTNEAHVLSAVVGQVLLVVRAGVTTQQMVTEALTHIEPGRQVSCVLNQASQGNMSDYYYYYEDIGRTKSGSPSA